MASPISPSGSTKRHSRNISYVRPRKSTTGPLEAIDDPLATTQPPVSPSVDSTSASAIEDQRQAESVSKLDASVDLSFLQNRENFHQLPTEDIPEAFLSSPNQPSNETSLSDLIQHGHFRRAGETAFNDLLQCAPNEATRILELLYTRLACLILISRPDLASVEGAPLIDFLARSTPEAEGVVSLIPWELRLLLVRLQLIAAPDGGRRGLMALNALVVEVHRHLHDARAAGNTAEEKTWTARLDDLALRVADAFVEMGELETATRHLDNLIERAGDNGTKYAYRKALLRFRIGDVAGAQRCTEKLEDQTMEKATLSTLVKVANGEYDEVMDEWRNLADQYPDNGLFASNLAVGLLYTGHIMEARQILEELSQRMPAFPGSLFNLGTVYELCTERSLEQKASLAQRMAAKQPEPDTGGWERANFEFKL